MFDDVFGDIFGASKGYDALSELDRQQAEEATRLSGATDKKMQQLFYDTFVKARKARKQNEALKI